LIIDKEERLCIVGRNGTGKSSLLKVLMGDLHLDDGSRQIDPSIRVAMLPQDPPRKLEATIYDYVAGAFEQLSATLSEYMKLSAALEHDASESVLNRLARVQDVLDSQGGWEVQQRIETTLTRLGLEPSVQLNSLSGGWLRRVALARAWVTSPDLLLLDEPTNHLDVETVQWLEQTLKEFNGAIVFISHDRAFIRSLATRILDLDRGQLTSFPGDYAHYLVEKQRLLEVEQAQNAEFDKKLAEEEVWIRQGIKARRTRNEGRVRALEALREERKARREQQSVADFSVVTAERSGKIVWEAENLTYRIADKTLIKNFTTTIQRGDKIAFVGPNGCGKSTLLKLILGQLEATEGKSKQGTKLNVAYYDQHRAILDPEKTVADNVGEGKQDVTHGGRTRHIYSYLQDFLFTPHQARTPLKALSGGERNRVLLAKILLQDCNLLVLDEPTNDLDVETLELLESIVTEFAGTVLLVSHDREFIENTASSVFLFEGQGQVTEIIGGFKEVELYKTNKAAQNVKIENSQGTSTTKSDSQQARPLAKGANKLSYKLKRELEEIPARIEQLEQELASLQSEVNAPDFFRRDNNVTQPILERVQHIEETINSLLERWDYLENFQDN